MSILKGLNIWVAIFAITVFLNPLSMPFAAMQEENANEEYKLETMTVTSQKREENVQDVPMGVSVFSGVQIEDAGIENTLELTRFAPNVYMRKSTNENVVVIRGISAFDDSVYSPSGFYVDDICFPLHYMHNPDLFDIERIEVLKGPQGTLYGRNTESGVINIITKQPNNEFRGKLFGGYGNYNTFQASGSISGPIVRDKLYLGFALQGKTSDGFMENEYNDDDKSGRIDHKNARSTLRWTPADKWDISLIADVMDTDDKTGVYRFATGTHKTYRYKVRHNKESYSKQDGSGQTLRVMFDGNSFNVLSVSGARYYRHNSSQDYDCTADPLNDWGSGDQIYRSRQFSEELRVSSHNNSRRFKWLFGLYGSNEKTDIDTESPEFSELRIQDTNINSYAVFGQVTYTMVDRLHLTTGLRYDRQELEGEQRYDFLDWIGNPQTMYFDKDLDYDELLPKFSIAFDIADNIMTYVSASKGYLVGGYNYATASDNKSFSYDSEYIWNYEAGIKTTWLADKLIANLAYFYIDIDDKQVHGFDAITHSSEVRNAAKAHSQGVEFELQARPLRGLELFGSFGYTEAKFDKWIATEWNSDYTDLVQYDYKDKYMQNAPKYTFNLGMQYRHNNGFFVRADLHGIGDFYGDPKNTVKEDAYQLVNLRLGYEREHFDILLWCDNLFDKGYETIKYDWAGDELVQDGEPRMFGLTVTYRF